MTFRISQDSEKSINVFEGTSKLYLYAFVCCSLATKFMQPLPHITPSSLVELFDGNIKKSEIQIIELNILNILEYNVRYNSPYDYLKLLLHLSGLPATDKLFK